MVERLLNVIAMTGGYFLQCDTENNHLPWKESHGQLGVFDLYNFAIFSEKETSSRTIHARGEPHLSLPHGSGNHVQKTLKINPLCFSSCMINHQFSYQASPD